MNISIPDEIPTEPSSPIITAPSTPTNAQIQQANSPPRLTRQNARSGYYDEVRGVVLDDVYNNNYIPSQREPRIRRGGNYVEYNSEGKPVQFGRNKICSKNIFVKNYMNLGNSYKRALLKYNKALFL